MQHAVAAGPSPQDDVVAVHVLDPKELMLPDAGRVCLEDPETGEQIVLNTSDPAVRRAFAERSSGQQLNLSNVLRKNGVERIHVQTDQDYVPALKSYFRARRRRKR